MPVVENRVVEDGKILVYHRDGGGPTVDSTHWLPIAQFEEGWHQPVAPAEHERRLEMGRNWTKDSPVGELDQAVKHRDANPEEERYLKLYGEKMVVCEDLKSKRAAKEWPRYAVCRHPDSGRIVEGPLPFRSSSERAEYLKRFGFKTPGGDER